jgi:membrane protease YdiL (CAAX protease family)
MRAKEMFVKYVARMSRPTPSFPAMQKFRYFMVALLLSNICLVVVRLIPNVFPGKNNPLNGIVSYAVLTLIYLGLMKALEISTLSFLRLPKVDWKTGLGIGISVGLVWGRIHPEDLLHRSFRDILIAAGFILAIGVGEEVVSRGFVYGIFMRFGQHFAIFFSALLFGALHLGWYMGKYWDPWMAYWHVFNAFAFGYFSCCLMIACRSIWPSIVLHALWDWNLGFDAKSVAFPKPGVITHSEFIAGVTQPLWQIVPMVLAGLLLVQLRRGSLPTNLEGLMLRFKLIESD